MPPTDSAVLWVVLALLGGAILGGLIMLARVRPVPPPPALPDPFAQIATQTGVISAALDMYQRQITALSAQIDRIEREKRDLFERVDKAEASNHALGDKLITMTDHVDYIYRTLEGFEAGRGWAASFRAQDPRTKAAAPPKAGEGTR